MNVLGIDPGATTGWCIYHGSTGLAFDSGEFPADTLPATWDAKFLADLVPVLERPRGQGHSYDDVVEAAITFGMLVGRFRALGVEPKALYRYDVRRLLSDATHGDIRVKNDATAWLALKLLHGGDGSAKKGGQLHGVKGHARAALAVAVAWCLQTDEPK